MTDLISRADVTAEIKKLYGSGNIAFDLGLEKAVSIIESMPSANEIMERMTYEVRTAMAYRVPKPMMEDEE